MSFTAGRVRGVPACRACRTSPRQQERSTALGLTQCSQWCDRRSALTVQMRLPAEYSQSTLEHSWPRGLLTPTPPQRQERKPQRLSIFFWGPSSSAGPRLLPECPNQRAVLPVFFDARRPTDCANVEGNDEL